MWQPNNYQHTKKLQLREQSFFNLNKETCTPFLINARKESQSRELKL